MIVVLFRLVYHLLYAATRLVGWIAFALASLLIAMARAFRDWWTSRRRAALVAGPPRLSAVAPVPSQPLLPKRPDPPVATIRARPQMLPRRSAGGGYGRGWL